MCSRCRTVIDVKSSSAFKWLQVSCHSETRLMEFVSTNIRHLCLLWCTGILHGQEHNIKNTISGSKSKHLLLWVSERSSKNLIVISTSKYSSFCFNCLARGKRQTHRGSKKSRKPIFLLSSTLASSINTPHALVAMKREQSHHLQWHHQGRCCGNSQVQWRWGNKRPLHFLWVCTIQTQFPMMYKTRLSPYNDNPTGRNILVTISSSIRVDHARILSCSRAAIRLVTLPWIAVTHRTLIHIPRSWRDYHHQWWSIGAKSAGILRWVHVYAATAIGVVRLIRAAPISSSLK